MTADIQTQIVLRYRYHFGNCSFDETRRELMVDGNVVAIEKRPVDVLLVLMRQPRQVVSADALLERAWPGKMIVAPNALNVAIGRLRTALNDRKGVLIANVSGEGYMLDSPVERVVVSRDFVSPLNLQAGSSISGRPDYLLDQCIGSSRNSEVWLARGVDSSEQRVFKFCADGYGLTALKREFTLYRVLLSALGDRPDYSRIISANFSTEPFYLESEYGGLNLARWAEQNGQLAAMRLPARLELFIGMVRAVADAHRVGVLHKDLKPTNILVAAAPVPPGGLVEPIWSIRLTDFGSGRLLDDSIPDRWGVRPDGMTLVDGESPDPGAATPMYLAPEVNEEQTATVQSDVYALGLMLYQLVAGNLNKRILPGWESDVADPLLRDDISRATQSDPALRLRSADELFERLTSLRQRHDAAELERKQAERHEVQRQAGERAKARRPLVVALVGLLAMGLAITGSLYIKTERALLVAREQGDRAQAINDFLNLDVLRSADITRAGKASTLSPLKILQNASEKASQRFSGQPLTEATVRNMLGRLFANIQDLPQAEKEFRRSEVLFRDLVPAGDDRLLTVRFELVANLVNTSRHQEAEKLLEQTERDMGAVRLQERTSLAKIAAKTRGSFLYWRQNFAAAKPFYERTVSLADELDLTNFSARANDRRMLAEVQFRLGEYSAAEKVLEVALAPPFNPETVGEVEFAKSQFAYGRVQMATGEKPETEALLTRSRDTLRRVLGPMDISAAFAGAELGSLYAARGEYESARAALEDARGVLVKRFGDNHQIPRIAALNLANVMLYLGQAQGALNVYDETRPAMLKELGETSAIVQGIDFSRAHAYCDLGAFERSFSIAQALDADKLAQASPGADWAFKLDGLKGRALWGMGKTTEARPLVERALEGMERLGTAKQFIEPLRRLIPKQAG